MYIQFDVVDYSLEKSKLVNVDDKDPYKQLTHHHPPPPTPGSDRLPKMLSLLRKWLIFLEKEKRKDKNKQTN